MTILNTGSTKKFSSNWNRFSARQDIQEIRPGGQSDASKKGAAKKSRPRRPRRRRARSRHLTLGRLKRSESIRWTNRGRRRRVSRKGAEKQWGNWRRDAI